MRRSFKANLVLVGLVAGATSLSALETTFSAPRYKGKERLDVCLTAGKSCGQKAADAACFVGGFERAVRFETGRARPTRSIGDGKRCDGAHCEAFKSITCFTSAKKPSPREWPTPHD